MKTIDRTGQKFNMLTVIRRVPSKHTRWECLCDCGNTTYVSDANLVRGAVKSCGCLKKKGNGGTHHKCYTRLYRIYSEILRRCYNPHTHEYPRYGGRGITMCDEWKQSFVAFYDWANNNGYSDELTIDRIDNDGIYSPENCRWATVTEQANNRRSCIMITRDGKTQSLKQWCDELNISYKTVHMRVRYLGWNIEKALTCPIRKGRQENNG